MASSLEGNKLIAALLTAGIIASGSGVVGRMLYTPHTLENPVYAFQTPEGDAAEASKEPAAAADSKPIGVLLASANVEEGEKGAKKCGACHNFEEGGGIKVGPDLYGVLGRDIGSFPGFTYSTAISGIEGNWDYEKLNKFLTSPKDYAPGTKMSFAGIRREDDRANVIAYLRSLSHNPEPLPPAADGSGVSPYRGFEGLAHRLADAAGEVHRRYFRRPVMVDTKADLSPVTIADRESEAVMRDLIRAAHPDHGIYGEEHGVEGLDREFVWCLDPIDGTKSFITGRPIFGALIALCHQGRPVLGIIEQAISRERWVGLDGAGAWWNGRPIRTRACASVADATLYATSPRMFVGEDERTGFAQLERTVRLPLYGGDCYAYGLLAMGLVDLVVEASLQPYDYMALVPVVQGAGGVITDWQGRALGFDSTGQAAAAGDLALHAEVLRLLAA